jgi:hypothetical protein
MRTGLAHQDARNDFDRARRRASWAKVAGWLRGRPSSRNRLPVLGEVKTDGYDYLVGSAVLRLSNWLTAAQVQVQACRAVFTTAAAR